MKSDTLQLCRRWGLKIIPWVLLGLAFVLFGVWVRQQIPASLYCGKDTEIYSFDFLGYAYTMRDFGHLGYGRFRHPLWGWLTAPAALFGHKLITLGEWHYWVFLLLVFATIGVACAWLLWRLLRKFAGLSVIEAWTAVGLYLSFAHVWLLAGMPETYGVSMMLALATLNWALGSSNRLAGWIVLAVLTGGVTITQLGKTALAYVLSVRCSMRKLVKTALLVGALVAAVVLVFYARVKFRVWMNPDAPGMDAAWHSLFDHVMPLSASWRDRIWQIWVFFSEPIILRGENFDVRVITRGYDSWLQPVLLLVLYGLVGTSAWLNRKTLLVRLIGAMFLVDVAIHFVVGWGLGESQLYGGHWMYGVPILVGMLLPRLDGRCRKIILMGVFVLAVLILLCNIHGYFFHDVAVVSS